VIRRVVRCDDRATGVFGTTFGLTVFLVFLLAAVQLLFGLYVRTTVTAVAADLAQRAANEGPGALAPARITAYEQEGAQRLGRYAERASFAFSLIDDDRDGAEETVAVRVDADLPTLLPERLVPSSPTRFTRTVRARLEVFQEGT
jgi:hypothetical protein